MSDSSDSQQNISSASVSAGHPAAGPTAKEFIPSCPASVPAPHAAPASVLPTFLTASARLRSGEEITLRPLQSDDAARLGDYFRSLSAETRSRYGPHPFDQETADAICAGIATDDVLRITATVTTGIETRIIGYFLLKRGVREDDSKRYELLGIPLDPQTDCTLAPSVSDDYQNQGIGGLLISHVLQIAPRIGRRRVVLWGGVQATNARAVHFYTKSGFRKVGEFFTDKPNFDMILDLEQGMVAQQAGGQEAKG